MATKTGVSGPISNGVNLCFDALNKSSYPGSGSSWRSLAGNSKSNRDATLFASPTYNANGYFSFNGTTQYAKRTAAPAAVGSDLYMSYNVWFRQTSSSVGRTNPVFCTEDNWMTTYIQNNLIQFSTLQGQGVGYDYTTGYTIPFDGTWVNLSVSATFGGPVYIYVNGVLVYTAGTNLDVPTYFSTFEIGSIVTSSWYFMGDIAYVAHYGIALTADEIKQNFNAMRGRFGL